MLVLGGAEATPGMHLHVDALPTSSWQLQCRAPSAGCSAHPRREGKKKGKGSAVQSSAR